ncbi:MAG: carbohydrate ABC transporter permease [Rhodobacter sp.]|nr:carbohydrate ABC transporter permease [Rhodobacter sp.]MCY4169623.1 carbohydrate ABC transporter permease [Rhodobacter sp.]MCY4243346.1 carbohydrate ABC transporter permease [Rhodobacter sp.]
MDDGIAGSKPALTWAVHISVALLVALWLFPTVGLFVSSFRTADQIATTGWWKALSQQERQNPAIRISGEEGPEASLFVIEGNLFEGEAEIRAWGTSSRRPEEFAPGETAELSDGRTLTVQVNGGYRFTAPESQDGKRLPRVFTTASSPPEFTLSNYDVVLGKDVVKRLIAFVVAAMIFGYVIRLLTRRQGERFASVASVTGGGALMVLFILLFGLSAGTVEGAQTTDSMASAFFSTLTVTIPATVIPILIAAFAAYALAWMDFPGRALLIAAVVALLVVPLQLALIPLLKLHLQIGIGKGYLGVWLAHTGFGLPLAIYLLRNYMVGLPRDIIENARVDGATDFQIFVRIILPLSFPALASFAIFQFLWTWNDLLVARVFLIGATGDTNVMTNAIVELLGTRGGNWEILATAAFVSIAVPLAVFFAMQKYLVRGLLAGSVK